MTTWLFSFHKAVGLRQDLFMNVFNGEAWGGDVAVPFTPGLTNTPAAVVFNSLLYLFYPRGQGLYYMTYEGEEWTAEVRVPNTAGISAGVAAAVYHDLIYLMYSNPGSTDLMYRTFDGTTFGPETDTSATNHLVGVAYQNLDTPAALVIGDLLYVFGRGPRADEPNNTNRFWYANFDRSGWRSNAVPGTRGLTNGPGAAWFNNRAWLLYNTPDGYFSWMTFDGRDSWGGEHVVPDTPGNQGNAAPVVFNETLYVLHQGPDGRYLYKTTDGEWNWTDDTAVPDSAGISCGPAAVTFTID